MKPSFFRAALVLAALSLAACGGDDAGQGGDDTATRPAGEQPAPSAQHQAAPQTGPNTPQGNSAEFVEPPVENRDTVHRAGPGQTYASCMAKARGAGEGERDILEQSCARLPDAPKR
ncbi:MAG TPA: hypothetical protein VEX86_09345 [Longimicrobium sp.]|nr:hypothetical protein [Longimicrobium sp.]